jgi:hypothetical protein
MRASNRPWSSVRSSKKDQPIGKCTGCAQTYWDGMHPNGFRYQHCEDLPGCEVRVCGGRGGDGPGAWLTPFRPIAPGTSPSRIVCAAQHCGKAWDIDPREAVAGPWSRFTNTFPGSGGRSQRLG